MSKNASRIIGIIAIVVSVLLGGYGVYWFVLGRPKHGLLFAALFVLVLLLGIVQLRLSASQKAQGAST